MGMRWTEEEYRKFQERAGQQEKSIYDKQEILDSVQEALDKFDEEESDKQPILLRDMGDPEPNFASKTERRAWYEWIPTTAAIKWYYEPMRLYLNSGSYRPDFALIMPNRALHLIEVKGNWHAYKSGRASKKSVKEAAKLYWWLAKFYVLLPVKGGGWDLQEIT